MGVNNLKIYKYNSLRYFLAVTAQIILLICILIWGILGILGNEPQNIHKLVVIVIPVLLITTIGSISQPDKVTDDDETITFFGFGRKHKYYWHDINFLRVREFPFTDRVYVRVGKGKLFSGRYWLDILQFENGKELLEKFKEIERILHPEVAKYQKR
mgnify:CR=1 FL=1